MSHQDQSCAAAPRRQRLQVGGAVETLDLNLSSACSGPQVEHRKRGVVDPKASESMLGLPQHGQHQTAQDCIVGDNQHGAVLLHRMTFGERLDEPLGLLHQLSKRSVAAAIAAL